jgi:methionyl aminopeptidase
MSVDTPEELEGLRAAGRVVAEAIREMRRAVRPGVTTAQLDAVAARVLRHRGARSAPALAYGFPGVACISVNDEAVHGIPGPRRLRDGDLVKLDVAVELDGFYADACETVVAGRGRHDAGRLVAAARSALASAIAVARAGAPLSEVGAAVEREAGRRGFAVCAELMGHGIGRGIHEHPFVPSHYDPRITERLTDGLVITIEPILSAGSGRVRASADGWTIVTADGAPTAHAEHTIVVTDGRPLLLTA